MNNQKQQLTHYRCFVRTAGFNRVLLSCRASGIEFYARAPARIDTDKDGRVRVLEMLASARQILLNLGKVAAEVITPPADTAHLC